MIRTISRFASKAFGFSLILTAMASSAQAMTPLNPGIVPEIDPGSILSALTLLGGGLMMITDRCRAK